MMTNQSSCELAAAIHPLMQAAASCILQSVTTSHMMMYCMGCHAMCLGHIIVHMAHACDQGNEVTTPTHITVLTHCGT